VTRVIWAAGPGGRTASCQAGACEDEDEDGVLCGEIVVCSERAFCLMILLVGIGNMTEEMERWMRIEERDSAVLLIEKHRWIKICVTVLQEHQYSG